MKNLKKILMLAVVAITAFSCKEDDPAPAAKPTITEIAAKNPDLTILVGLLQRTGLDKTLAASGTYTVFAPTNAAFNAYGSASIIASLPDATVKELLLNHVLVVKKNSADLTAGYVSTLATGAAGTKMSLYVDLAKNAGKVTLNGNAIVTTPNVDASNGVIHVVDKVLSLHTLVEAAQANPSFKTLVSALTNTAQAATLKVLTDATAANPLTVLAPTDGAFTNATWANGATQSQLTTVLQYHVATGNKVSTGLTNAQEITTVGGQKLKVVKTTDVKFEDQAGNRGSVIAADVQCSNGVIHAISAVMQPSFTEQVK